MLWMEGGISCGVLVKEMVLMVRVMVENLCEKMVELKVSNRLMAIALVFKMHVQKLTCGYAPQVLVRSVMSLPEDAKIRLSMDSELSEEIEVNVGMNHESVLPPFHFAVVVDADTELAR